MSSGTNNLPAVRFHSVHGENIRTSGDGAVARRVESFCKGITFSNRPVRINERIYIKFLEMSTSWSGAIRLGFTCNDPNTYRNNLPKYACPDLKNRPGNWAKALSERLAQRDSILCFYINEEGNVNYSIDGDDKGVFLTNVDTNNPLWAIIDIYGNTCALELIDPRTNLNNARSDVNVLVSQLSSSSISRENREPLPQIYRNMELHPLPFHRTKGCNIKLNNDRTIAERNSNHYCQGYVFTQRPLNMEEKLVFQILQTDQLYTGSLAFGLTICNPSSISSADLPEDPHQLLERPEYWVVIKDVTTSPVAGDELAVKICDNGEVKLFKNRQPPVTLMHVDQSQKFYAFFDLYGSTIKIKSLGSITEIHNLSQSQINHVLPGYQQSNQAIDSNTSSARLPLMDKSNYKALNVNEPETNVLSECTVCYEKPINSVLYVCGHMCMCYECAVKQWKGRGGGQCPICRAMIMDVIRTYMS